MEKSVCCLSNRWSKFISGKFIAVLRIFIQNIVGLLTHKHLFFLYTQLLLSKRLCLCLPGLFINFKYFSFTYFIWCNLIKCFDFKYFLVELEGKCLDFVTLFGFFFFTKQRRITYGRLTLRCIAFLCLLSWNFKFFLFLFSFFYYVWSFSNLFLFFFTTKQLRI